jgi:ribonuclease R
VRVQVSRVDLDGRKIDFRIVREGDVDRVPGRADKPRVHGAVEELAAVRQADRAVKSASRALKKPGASTAGDTARRTRKPAPQRAVPRPRTRR